jgi:TPR repeat protein
MTRPRPWNFAQGLKSWGQAAKLGHFEAFSQLGQAYQLGQGLKIDQAKALKNWRLAADQGMAEALNKLGQAYQLGLGLKKTWPRP